MFADFGRESRLIEQQRAQAVAAQRALLDSQLAEKAAQGQISIRAGRRSNVSAREAAILAAPPVMELGGGALAVDASSVAQLGLTAGGAGGLASIQAAHLPVLAGAAATLAASHSSSGSGMMNPNSSYAPQVHASTASSYGAGVHGSGSSGGGYPPSPRGFGRTVSEITRGVSEEELHRRARFREELVANLEVQVKEKEARKARERVAKWEEEQADLAAMGLSGSGRPRPALPPAMDSSYGAGSAASNSLSSAPPRGGLYIPVQTTGVSAAASAGGAPSGALADVEGRLAAAMSRLEQLQATVGGRGGGGGAGGGMGSPGGFRAGYAPPPPQQYQQTSYAPTASVTFGPGVTGGGSSPVAEQAISELTSLVRELAAEQRQMKRMLASGGVGSSGEEDAMHAGARADLVTPANQGISSGRGGYSGAPTPVAPGSGASTATAHTSRVLGLLSRQRGGGWEEEDGGGGGGGSDAGYYYQHGSGGPRTHTAGSPSSPSKLLDPSSDPALAIAGAVADGAVRSAPSPRGAGRPDRQDQSRGKERGGRSEGPGKGGRRGDSASSRGRGGRGVSAERERRPGTTAYSLDGEGITSTVKKPANETGLRKKNSAFGRTDEGKMSAAERRARGEARARQEAENRKAALSANKVERVARQDELRAQLLANLGGGGGASPAGRPPLHGGGFHPVPEAGGRVGGGGGYYDEPPSPHRGGSNQYQQHSYGGGSYPPPHQHHHHGPRSVNASLDAGGTGTSFVELHGESTLVPVDNIAFGGSSGGSLSPLAAMVHGHGGGGGGGGGVNRFGWGGGGGGRRPSVPTEAPPSPPLPRFQSAASGGGGARSFSDRLQAAGAALVSQAVPFPGGGGGMGTPPKPQGRWAAMAAGRGGGGGGFGGPAAHASSSSSPPSPVPVIQSFGGGGAGAGSPGGGIYALLGK